LADNELQTRDGDSPSSKRATDVDVQIGNRVRMKRMLRGLSQERLGELLSVTFQQVQKYERGTNRISASRLFQLAKVLDVPLAYFYEDVQAASQPRIPGFAEEGTDESNMMAFLATREGIELNRAFQRISDPAKRRAVVELVRTMAGEDGEK
jgi:transcriptional regulator with XRE-family HTH domain